MGLMKEFDIRIRGGGNDAIAAVNQYSSLIESRLLELQQSLPAWIDASAELPAEYQTVLVLTEAGISAGEVRFPDSECGMTEPWWMVFKHRESSGAEWAGFVPRKGVSHWMRLPDPPR
jgi:hypothetical protein